MSTETLRPTGRDALRAGTTTITSADGTEIEAYVALPDGDEPRGAMVVIHHLPGYDAGTKEITRRLATMGYSAVCPNLYSRQAPGADPDDAAALVRAQGGVPDAQVVSDVDGAAQALRALPTSNGKVGVIGYCSGGRHAFLAATSLALDAAVDCYGAYVTGVPEPDFPLKVTPLVDRTPRLSCPLLGLFGREDTHPSPEQVSELVEALRRNGKDHEIHVFDDAGHAFFSADRPAYRQKAATEGWRVVEAFLARTLG